MPSSDDSEELRLLKIVAARSNNSAIPDQDLNETTQSNVTTGTDIPSHSGVAVPPTKGTITACSRQRLDYPNATATNRKRKTDTKNEVVADGKMIPRSTHGANESEELHLLKIVAARANMDAVPAIENPTPRSCSQVPVSGRAGSLTNNQRTTAPNDLLNDQISPSEEFTLMKVVAARGEGTSRGKANHSTTANASRNEQGFASASTVVEAEDVEEAVPCPPGKRSIPRGANAPGAYSRAPGQQSQRLDNVQYETAVGTMNGTNDDGADFLPANVDLNQSEAKGDPNEGADFLPANVELNQSEAKGDPNEGPPEEARKKHLIMGVVGIGIMILFAVVLLLVFLLPGDSSDPETTPTDLEKEQISANEVIEDVLKLLPDNTLQALETKDSPQAKAYQWLIGDPALLEGTYSDARILQRFVLATFFFALNGIRWTTNNGWLDHAENECTWRGLECQTLDDEDGVVHSIVLKENRLRGTLPEELCLFNGITNIDLQDNAILGSIPLCLFNQANQGSLTINLDGNDDAVLIVLPTQIDQLTHMKVINIPLFGSLIPSEVGLLKSLEAIRLRQKDLSGKIPSELGNLKLLHTLDLSSNCLRGSVPSELGNLERLKTLDLSSNKCGRAFHLQTEWTALTGSVPSELGVLKHLIELNLKNNHFNGSIPSGVGTLNSLNKLDLTNNEFFGPIPTELGQLEVLMVVDLAGNYLIGSVPSELGGLNSLKKLDLSRNQLMGSIPTELGSQQTLSLLDLQRNALSGSIPSELGTIDEVFLNNNRLTGRVPEELNRSVVTLGGNPNLITN